VAERIVPGLVLLFASGGRTLFHEAYGFRQITPRRLRVAPDTVYDVASLTKAVVTSVLTMQLVDQRLLSLDEPVATRLPDFHGPGKEGVTVRHLLAHASGLPAHRRYWNAVSAAASERWAISLLAAHEPLEYPTGSRSVYSDLGFILLGWLLERAAGLRLDVQAARGIFQPLGLGSTTFINLADTEARARLLANRSVAATQLCAERQRVVLGEVDDLNAYAMGGIAGHAGLFSDAVDLGILAGALCSAWQSPTGSHIASRDVIRTFWAPAGVPGSTWRLGWDGPSSEGRRPARAYRAPPWATWVLPAARCGSIPSASCGSYCSATESTPSRPCRAMIGFAAGARACMTPCSTPSPKPSRRRDDRSVMMRLSS